MPRGSEPRVRRMSWYVRAWIVDAVQAISVITVLQSTGFLARRGWKGSERPFAAAVNGNAMNVIFALALAGLPLQWATTPVESASLVLLFCHHPKRGSQKRAMPKAGVMEAMIDFVGAMLYLVEVRALTHGRSWFARLAPC